MENLHVIILVNYDALWIVEGIVDDPVCDLASMQSSGWLVHVNITEVIAVTGFAVISLMP